MRRPPAPSDLETAGRAFWRKVLSACVLSDSELILLAETCKTLDRLSILGAEIGKNGVVRPDGGLSALVSEERLQRGALAALLKQLALPVEEDESPSATSVAAPVRLYGRGA